MFYGDEGGQVGGEGVVSKCKAWPAYPAYVMSTQQQSPFRVQQVRGTGITAAIECPQHWVLTLDPFGPSLGPKGLGKGVRGLGVGLGAECFGCAEHTVEYVAQLK
jgi:hypothetical protein